MIPDEHADLQNRQSGWCQGVLACAHERFVLSLVSTLQDKDGRRTSQKTSAARCVISSHCTPYRHAHAPPEAMLAAIAEGIPA